MIGESWCEPAISIESDLRRRLDDVTAASDRLASDLQATRAELERVRLANRVLDSAAKDAQAWAYQLQECRAELARVRRNHLRRMRDLIELILHVMPFTRDQHWWRHRERLLGKLRAALATMENNK